MSTSSAIAAVTALLKEQAEAALDPFNFGVSRLVTVGPPQVVRAGRTDPQVNLFLYQVTPDAGWRNRDLPCPGGRAYPLLPLRLHYLITAFGQDDDDGQAHELLGAVMLRLHARPDLPGTGTATVIAASQLAAQPEPVRITLHPMSPDDAAKLWSGFQSPYRLSVAYEAAVVLIETDAPVRSAPPVLSRGAGDDPGFGADPLAATPTLDGVRPPAGLTGPRLAPPAWDGAAGWLPDLLTLTGRNLDHPDLRLIFRHPRLPVGLIARVTTAIERKPERLAVRLPRGLTVCRDLPGELLSTIEAGVAIPPTDFAAWPAGVWTVAAARAVRVNGVVERLFSTPPVAFGLLPDVFPDAVGVPFELGFAGTPPDVTAARLRFRLATPVPRATSGEPLQPVKLFLGGLELVGPVATADGKSFEWTATDAAAVRRAVVREPAAGRLLRVQVDGVDSSVLAESAPGANPVPVPARKFDVARIIPLKPAPTAGEGSPP